jgi:hypothetical protein
MEDWLRQPVVKHPGHADQSVHGNGGKNSPRLTGGQPNPNHKPLGGPLKTRITPSKDNESQRARMTSYMDGFHSKLKNPAERDYAAARAKQMINGEKRPSGMSSEFGVDKGRVKALEIVLYKVFKAGRAKIGV